MQVIKKRNTREPLNQQKPNSIVNYEGWIQDREGKAPHSEIILSTYQTPMVNLVNAQWTEYNLTQREEENTYEPDKPPALLNLYQYSLDFYSPYNALYSLLWDGSDPPWLHTLDFGNDMGIYNWSFNCNNSINGTIIFLGRHSSEKYWKNDGTQTIALSFYSSKNSRINCLITIYQDGTNFDLTYPVDPSDIFKYCNMQFVAHY